MMVEVIIVADYIVEKTNEWNSPINNLKLQKIMFFLNVEHLITYNTSLIALSSFKKWSYGPAIKSVYTLYAYHFYGGKPITKVLDYSYLTKARNEFEVRTYHFSKNDLNLSTRQFIDKNLKLLINYKTADLLKEIQRDPQWQNRASKYDENELIKYYSSHQFWKQNNK